MTKTICSIYYSALQDIRRPLYQGIFHVDVVKKGDPPFFLTIKDHWETNDLPYFAGTNGNRPYKQRVTITGEQIAEDVLTHWTKYHPEMTPQCAPGMWIIRDVVYLWDESGKPMIDAEGRHAFRQATREERESMFAEDLAAAIERQTSWCETALRKGDVMADDPKKVPWVPQYCMDSVDYSGRERAWRHGLRDGDVKSCPICTKSIASKAFRCPHCAGVIDAVADAAFKVRQDEALRAENAKIKLVRDTEKAAVDAERLRQERDAAQVKRHADKAVLMDEGDKLVAAAEARSARIAAEREAEEAKQAMAGATPIPPVLQRDNSALEASK